MSLWEQFAEHGRVDDCPIYDMHGHWGAFYGIHFPAADPALAARLMERAGVRRLVMCHHDTLFCPDVGNKANVDAVRAMPDVLRAYCGLNPNYPDQIARDVESFDEYGDVFVGFKMHPDYHNAPMTDKRHRPALELADQRGLILLSHTWGGSANDGYEQVKALADTYSNIRLLMGHSIYGDWDHAIELARDYPNVYLELTAIVNLRGVLERFVDEAGSTKVVFGTDFPWFNHHSYIGGVLGAPITDEERRDIFYRNAQRILGEPEHPH